MEWQPIETAPTWQPAEGANICLGAPEILVGWDNSKSVALAYWHPDRAGGGHWQTIPSGWMLPPTHWMPLPDAPIPAARQTKP